MYISEAKTRILRDCNIADFLERDSAGKFCCPICGSGTGPHRSANTRHDAAQNKLFCFQHSGGEKGMDVIDVYRAQHNCGFREAVQELGNRLHLGPLEPDGGRDRGAGSPAAAPQGRHSGADRAGEYPYTTGSGKAPQGASVGGTAVPAAPAAGQGVRPPADYREYYQQCLERLQDDAAGEPGRNYLQGRGISLETACLFGVGYDPAAQGRGLGTVPRGRLIIPLSESCFVGRAVDPNCPKEWAKRNSYGGNVVLFNSDALWTDASVCVLCEGWADALTFAELGIDAVALNGTSNKKRLIERLSERHPTATLILCFDRDEAGRKCTNEVAEELRRLGVSFLDGSEAICGPLAKDANEAFTADREGFQGRLAAVRKQAEKKPDTLDRYIAEMMNADIERNRDVIPTGFPGLDKQLGGGLHAGLYAVPAISSLGKTTFLLQIADHVAQSGRDVLFFSLEMSRLELVSKSIARRLSMQDKDIPSIAIRQGTRLQDALGELRAYQEDTAPRFSVIEGSFDINAMRIADYVRRYAKRNGCAPLCVIDYLQIVNPGEGTEWRGTRESIDDTVKQLKLLSREIAAPVVVISSVGRANYLTPVSFESLKESGGIEYTADCVLGLQLQTLSDPGFDGLSITEKRARIDKAKAENPRKIQLCCLKNRYGPTGWNANFNYFPRVDRFEEVPQDSISHFSAMQPQRGKVERRTERRKGK